MKNQDKTEGEFGGELEALRSELEFLKIEVVRVKGEMKTAIAELEAEKAKSDAIIAALGDALSIQDTDFKVLYQNQVHKGMVGGHTGEYCYKAYGRNEEICDGCPVELSMKDGMIHKFEKRVGEGRKITHVEITASPLRDSTGRIVAGIELVRDISERKRVEEALQASEERYRALFENARDAILILHAEGEEKGRIVAANPAAATMHGYTIDELLGLTIADLDGLADASMVPRRIDRVLKKGWIKAELEHRRKDGGLFPVEISAGLMTSGGRKYIFAFDRDITDRKNYEQEREALIAELKEALEKIRTLKGLLPMCAWCNKIRDDQGYWKKVEEYIQEHSEAVFTHGICPECLREHSPDLYRKIADDGDEV